jgi:uncharacterized membrane protein YkoI
MMKRYYFLIGAILVWLSGGLAADESQLEARQLAEEGKILSLQEILQHIDQNQPGQILEVELERERGRVIYEIELLDPQGTVWELKVDAASGELLERELED